ncbi:transport protein Avl9-domain-containing protein [Vararia minispora EC-137]|uniref:Transport protein Avl9-domain-containing protein n=1 Tax=Vararia minispora EC-137 TaxID=1314806 RepID=A0ACB8QDF9_9AGAM|nr:transport protein Avl9-domain-containing protein [Vararia minispora EC-137]
MLETVSAATGARAVTYPPPPPQQQSSRESVASFATSASSSSRKARPESVLVEALRGPIVLGIALVDFNHQVGPRIEYSKGDVFEDEEVAKILPFLALPDGAHLSVEDYSYFHLVPTSPNPTTVFGISCNRQIATSALFVKEPDMTRSTVQKAVVVLASKPVFGPIRRDRLGVITNALFEQRDFTDTSILDAFHESLEPSLRSQLTESGLYMGVRELVRQFRHRTLVLVKALMLQKKAGFSPRPSPGPIMFFGHPVEKLCTSQYSLISLFPGLLQTLEDCGSPPLAARAPTLSPPTSLKTSDRKSMMAFVGFPLDLFGKDAFFQPYLPLQQLDLIKSQTQSFLCGSTNSIVTQSKDIDILVNIETGTLEFRDLKAERAVGLTPADRKWIDEIVRDVGAEGAEEGTTANSGRRFKGSDDYLRAKFEEYISAALASIKYADFLAKGDSAGVLITPGSGDSNAQVDFNPVWIAEFRRTNAFEVWQRITDSMLFDIVEPRHPCGEKPSAISDIGLRLSEGIQDLKLDQQLAPAREAVKQTLYAGSTNFLKAVEGVRGRWMQRTPSSETSPVPPAVSPSVSSDASASGIEVIAKSEAEGAPPTQAPLSPDLKAAVVGASERISSWGAGIGSFFAARTQRTSVSPSSTPGIPTPPPVPPTPPATGSKLKSFRMSTHGTVLGDRVSVLGDGVAGLSRRPGSPVRRPTSPARSSTGRVSPTSAPKLRSLKMSSTPAPPRTQSPEPMDDEPFGRVSLEAPRESAVSLRNGETVRSGEEVASFGMAL